MVAWSLDTKAKVLPASYKLLHAKFEIVFKSINTDPANSKLLLDLAKKLGAEVLSIKKDQYEDIILGNQMDKIKTNELVSKNEILSQLKSK